MVSIRHVAALVTLVALLPAGVFFGAPVVPLGLVVGCVLLVAASLYLLFGPSEAAAEGADLHADAA
jgi:hypothetical protein